MSLNLQLNTPIRVKNYDIGELTLRDPVTADFFRLGLPFVVFSAGDDAVMGLEFRMKVLAQFIGRLADINPDVVKTMSMRDVGRCQSFILSFLDKFEKESDHG